MRRLLLGLVVAIATLVPNIAMADDQEIARHIMSKLQTEQQQGALKGFHIDMRVDQGTVWYKGFVSNQEQKDLILRTAQQAQNLGVVQVVDDITIREAEETDAQQTAYYQDAAFEAPAAEAPAAEAPAAEAPAAEAPAAEAPAAEVAAEPTQQPMPQPIAQQPMQQPIAQQPMQQPMPQPMAQQPMPQPIAQQPMAQPMPQPMPQPIAQQPIAQVQGIQPQMNIPTPNQMPMAANASAPMYAAPMYGEPMMMGHDGHNTPMAMNQGAQMPVGGDAAALPPYAWPSYAANSNYAAVNYPGQYSASSWPYIGPFYPYPQVPLGWRKVTLEWDDGWWWLDFNNRPR